MKIRTLSGMRWIPLLLLLLLASCSEEGGEAADPQPELPSFDGFPTADTGGGTDGSEGSDASDGTDGTDGDLTGPICCTEDVVCPEGLFCARMDGVPGQCRSELVEGECYGDAGCGVLEVCEDAVLCDCNDPECRADPSVQHPGTCRLELPAGCCVDDEDCPEGTACAVAGEVGRCQPVPSPGGCWRDADCSDGQACEGAQICDCVDDCEFGTPGLCSFATTGNCHTDADCAAGQSCMAGTQCDPGCALGDASCCSDSTCIDEAPQCRSDFDCVDGLCQAAGTCYPWCEVNDPTCCFGNVCVPDPCAVPNPQGCASTGCDGGQVCAVTSDQCFPSSCECVKGVGWSCVDDCLGGACVDSACPGQNPQGCIETGCPAGLVCQVAGTCAPSACTCDELAGAWTCSPDCSGGVCVVP